MECGLLYNECSQWWDSGETPGEGNETPLVGDVSEKHRQEGTANSTGLVVTCGWGFPEPQSTFCSSFITLQTRVIHRPHVWWLWQPEIKNKLWFFPVAKVIVPSAHRLRTRAHETTVWVKACLLLKWPANSLQPTVIWFPWIHRGRPPGRAWPAGLEKSSPMSHWQPQQSFSKAAPFPCHVSTCVPFRGGKETKLGSPVGLLSGLLGMGSLEWWRVRTA